MFRARFLSLLFGGLLGHKGRVIGHFVFTHLSVVLGTNTGVVQGRFFIGQVGDQDDDHHLDSGVHTVNVVLRRSFCAPGLALCSTWAVCGQFVFFLTSLF